MPRFASRAALLGAAALFLGSCGQSGGGSASSQPAASGASAAASSAPAAASDTAVSSAAASALPPVAAQPPAATPAAAAAVQVAERKREPTAAELLRDDPTYQARERRLEGLFGNARDRDPTGQVEREHSAALAERRACVDKACLDAWFRRREAALHQYVDN
jgi:hypothetical protein